MELINTPTVNEPNDDDEVCNVDSYLQDREIHGHYNKVIKNDFMTLCRSLVKYVFELSDSSTLAFMNNGRSGGSALKVCQPGFGDCDALHRDQQHRLPQGQAELCHGELCLGLAIYMPGSMVASHSKILHSAVVVFLMSSWFGIMATSNPWRHMARQEHMSWIERKRQRRMIHATKKQFVSMMMICSCASSAAMEQDAIFQRIISLTEAATTAALAAEQTLSQIHSMSSSTPASSEGLQAASRIFDLKGR